MEISLVDDKLSLSTVSKVGVVIEGESAQHRKRDDREHFTVKENVGGEHLQWRRTPNRWNSAGG